MPPTTARRLSAQTTATETPVTDGLALARAPEQDDEQACDESKQPTSPSEATVPSTARDLWREALDKLDKRTRQELRIENSEQKSLQQQIDELVDTARTKQKECEEKSWKFTVGNHEIVLRDQAGIIMPVEPCCGGPW